MRKGWDRARNRPAVLSIVFISKSLNCIAKNLSKDEIKSFENILFTFFQLEDYLVEFFIRSASIIDNILNELGNFLYPRLIEKVINIFSVPVGFEYARPFQNGKVL